MTSYDPESDPRYIPAPGGVDVLPPWDQHEIDKLQTAQRAYESLLSTFQTPGWVEFVAIVKKNREEMDAKLIKENDPMEWKVLRGQLHHADWILQVPDEAERLYRQVIDKLQDLTREGADG